MELQLLQKRQQTAAAKTGQGKVPESFLVETQYGRAVLEELRERVVDGVPVFDIKAALPYGTGYLSPDAISGTPIRFKAGDRVTTPFGPGVVTGMLCVVLGRKTLTFPPTLTSHTPPAPLQSRSPAQDV